MGHKKERATHVAHNSGTSRENLGVTCRKKRRTTKEGKNIFNFTGCLQTRTADLLFSELVQSWGACRANLSAERE